MVELYCEVRIGYNPRHAPVPAMLAATEHGLLRARSPRRFVLPIIHFIPDFLTYLVPLYLKRQCDRTLGLLSGGPVFDRALLQPGVLEAAMQAGTEPGAPGGGGRVRSH